MISYSVLEADLTRDEGYRSRLYKDSRGYWTIGIGHNLDAEGLCPAAVKAQFDYDLHTKAFEPLDRHIPWWREQPDTIQRVLVNLMFNMGPGTLMGFKNTLQLIHTGQYKPAAAALRTSRYAKQVGARAERLAKLLESVV